MDRQTHPSGCGRTVTFVKSKPREPGNPDPAGAGWDLCVCVLMRSPGDQEPRWVGLGWWVQKWAERVLTNLPVHLQSFKTHEIPHSWVGGRENVGLSPSWDEAGSPWG